MDVRQLSSPFNPSTNSTSSIETNSHDALTLELIIGAMWAFAVLLCCCGCHSQEKARIRRERERQAALRAQDIALETIVRQQTTASSPPPPPPYEIQMPAPMYHGSKNLKPWDVEEAAGRV